MNQTGAPEDPLLDYSTGHAPVSTAEAAALLDAYRPQQPMQTHRRPCGGHGGPFLSKAAGGRPSTTRWRYRTLRNCCRPAGLSHFSRPL